MACEDSTPSGEIKFNAHLIIIFPCWMLNFIKSISRMFSRVFCHSVLFSGKKSVQIASSPTPLPALVLLCEMAYLSKRKKNPVPLTLLTVWFYFQKVIDITEKREEKYQYETLLGRKSVYMKELRFGWVFFWSEYCLRECCATSRQQELGVSPPPFKPDWRINLDK